MAKRISAPGEKGFSSILSSFTGNLEDPFYFIISMIPVLEKYDQAALGKREKLKEILKGVPRGPRIETRKKISESEEEDELENLARRVIRMLRENIVWPWIDKDRTELLYRTSFIMLLSYFDYLMSDIIHYYYKYILAHYLERS